MNFSIHSWDGDDMIIRLNEPVAITTSAGVITIPEGFLSDGLSIPSLARPFVGPATGPAFAAGLLHDYLYSRASPHDFSRKDCDVLFMEAMGKLGTGFRRHVIYCAVRIFGSLHFKRK